MCKLYNAIKLYFNSGIFDKFRSRSIFYLRFRSGNEDNLHISQPRNSRKGIA